MRSLVFVRWISRFLSVTAMLASLAAWSAEAAGTLELAPSTKIPAALGLYYDVLEDPTGKLSIKDVSSPAMDGGYKPNIVADPNLGYSNSYFWLRTFINHTLPSPKQWQVEVPFPTLDSVEIYVIRVENGKIIYHEKTGDLLPFATRPFSHRHFVFPVTFPAETKVAVYLRVESKGSLTVGSYLWDAEAFFVESRNSYFTFALYFGLLMALGAYNFLLYLSLKDKTYLYYVLFVVSMALAQGAWNGFWYEYLWPNSPRWANVATVTGFDAAGFFGAVFSRVFLGTKRTAPFCDKAIIICAVVFGALLLTIPVTPYTINAKLTSAFAVIISLVMIAAGVVSALRGFSAARIFLVAWSIMLIGVAALGARNLGWLPTNFATLYSILIGSGLEALLLSFALAERIRVLERSRDQAQEDAYLARRTMIEALERTEKNLEARVNERTGYLTEVNEKLLESEKLLKSLAHFDPLTGMANRILLDERLGKALTRAARHGSPLAVILVDLDGFKEVNDTYGHAHGDELLKTVASRILRCVRESDTVARIGGDEFVLLLEELHGTDDAIHVCDKILKSNAEPVVIKGAGITIGASVGLAIYPDDGAEPQTLVKRADRAMYDAKRAGKGILRLAPGAQWRAAKKA